MNGTFVTTQKQAPGSQADPEALLSHSLYGGLAALAHSQLWGGAAMSPWVLQMGEALRGHPSPSQGPCAAGPGPGLVPQRSVPAWASPQGLRPASQLLTTPRPFGLLKWPSSLLWLWTQYQLLLMGFLTCLHLCIC